MSAPFFLSLLVCLIILQSLYSAGAPSLFAVHILCMAPMAPLGALALTAVKQRKSPHSVSMIDEAAKKDRVESFVIWHSFLASFAICLAFIGLVAIYQQKEAFGKPHLQTIQYGFALEEMGVGWPTDHLLIELQFLLPYRSSWAGVLTCASWLVTFLSAQPHVWRDQWRSRRLELFSKKVPPRGS